MKHPTRHKRASVALKRGLRRSLIVPEVVTRTPAPQPVPQQPEPRPATALTEAELQEIINAAYN